MGLFDSLFGGYKAINDCPNCDCTFEAEISDRQPMCYCPDCGYMLDYSMAPDASNSILKDSTVRLYKELREEILDAETEVKLTSSTPVVKFPKHLDEKIRYAGHPLDVLYFKGVMSEKERKSLLKLSHTKSYRKAIDALSQNSHTNCPLKTVKDELEVLTFAMFVMKDKVMDVYYATQGKKRYKKVLSKFYEDLLHYAVNQIYLKGKTAKEEEVDDFIDNFCNVLVPERNIQYDECSRAYSLRVLKEGLNDIYRDPIETFLDNLGVQHGVLLNLSLLTIPFHIAGVLNGLAAGEQE